MSRTIVYHLHFDPKFANPTLIFDEERFDNRYILLLTQGQEYHGKLHATRYEWNLSSAERVLAQLADADVVILYSLEALGARIVNSLPRRTVVIWRFFGYELYSKLPEFIYTKETRAYLHCGSPECSWRIICKRVVSFPRRVCRALRSRMSKCLHAQDEFSRAVRRIDYFWCLARAEYDFLRRHFFLPPFLQLPHPPPPSPSLPEKKENLVILGHSRFMYGNHLNILQAMHEVPASCLSDKRFLMFFSYGVENAYTAEVRRQAALLPGVELLEKFMPIEEFRTLYTEAAALVIYAYRQVAMGNIYTALNNGTKVYLPSENVMFEWLRNEGFILSDIRDFADDVRNDNLCLTPEQMCHNRQVRLNMSEKYPTAATADAVLGVVKQRRVAAGIIPGSPE